MAGVMQRFKGRVAFDQSSARGGLTARAGGGQASALQLSGRFASVTVVGTAADSVKLPAATVGAEFFLSNDAAANALQMFGLGTDTINNIATATGISLAAGLGAQCVCTKAGNWSRYLQG